MLVFVCPRCNSLCPTLSSTATLKSSALSSRNRSWMRGTVAQRPLCRCCMHGGLNVRTNVIIVQHVLPTLKWHHMHSTNTRTLRLSTPSRRQVWPAGYGRHRTRPSEKVSIEAANADKWLALDDDGCPAADPTLCKPPDAAGVASWRPFRARRPLARTPCRLLFVRPTVRAWRCCGRLASTARFSDAPSRRVDFRAAPAPWFTIPVFNNSASPSCTAADEERCAPFSAPGSACGPNRFGSSPRAVLGRPLW